MGMTRIRIDTEEERVVIGIERAGSEAGRCGHTIPEGLMRRYEELTEELAEAERAVLEAAGYVRQDRVGWVYRGVSSAGYYG